MQYQKNKGLFTFPILLSINWLNDFLDSFEDIISNTLILCFDKCRNPKYSKNYSYIFSKTCDFLFVILDYLYKDLNSTKTITIKSKLIKYNISCYGKFYELVGFIVMTINNHFTSIILSNINDNNEYDCFYYNDMKNNEKVIKIHDTFEKILKSYIIYIM